MRAPFDPDAPMPDIRPGFLLMAAAVQEQLHDPFKTKVEGKDQSRVSTEDHTKAAQEQMVKERGGPPKSAAGTYNTLKRIMRGPSGSGGP